MSELGESLTELGRQLEVALSGVGAAIVRIAEESMRPAVDSFNRQGHAMHAHMYPGLHHRCRMCHPWAYSKPLAVDGREYRRRQRARLRRR